MMPKVVEIGDADTSVLCVEVSLVIPVSTSSAYTGSFTLINSLDDRVLVLNAVTSAISEASNTPPSQFNTTMSTYRHTTATPS